MSNNEVLEEIVLNSVLLGSIVSLWGLYNEELMIHTVKNCVYLNYNYPYKKMFMYKLLPLISLGLLYSKSIIKLEAIKNYSK